MAKQIKITRGPNGITFETVSITPSELVFWTNEDPQQGHQPSLISNELGPAPSPNSSLCPAAPNPLPTTPIPVAITYSCTKHAGEPVGTILVYAEFQAGPTSLPKATVGTPIATQTVATGGKSPYSVTGLQFQVTNSQGQVIASGVGPGPGLMLSASANSTGISVSGTPTVAGTYTFTFNATDAMGLNVQQNQFTMVVST